MRGRFVKVSLKTRSRHPPRGRPAFWASPNRPLFPESAAPLRAKKRAPERRLAKARRPQLGTGHGRDESSYATRVAFERASSTPAQVVSIRYDRRDNLIAMGVLPAPAYAERTPQPFPGDMRFAPDPR